MILDKNELHKLPKFAGIYIIKNNINGKAYIGQSVMIKKRISQHIFSFLAKKVNNLLYKAMDKYGIKNFSVEVLETFKNLSKDELIKILDEKEIYYISKYNTYGPNGYNQTKGGDKGILGYKMTDVQLNTIKFNSYNIANDGRNSIYCYNIDDKSTIHAVSTSALSNILNITFYTSSLKNKIVANKYILARTEEELKNKVSSFYEELERNTLLISKGQFHSKLTDYMISDIKKGIDYKSFMLKYKVCKKTFYNYKHMLLDNNLNN